MKRNQRSSSLSFEEKWSPEIAQWGHTQVPNYLLKHQAELGLSKSELVVLLQLMTFDYGSRIVEPAHSTLAKSIGIKDSAVRQNIVSLEHKGFIKRHYKQGFCNEYSLVPTVDKLRSHSYQHPAKKRTGAYQKPGRPPPQKLDTKEYSPKRISNKTESIKEIISKRIKENGNENFRT